MLRYDEVDSTQRVARELADAGAVHGTVVVAETQTAGRGTRGRSWWSPPGTNLYATVVLRPACPPPEAPLIGLGVAAALAESLDLLVKWPNDLVDTEGHKVAGLLAEMETQGLAVRYVLLGIGLNVNQTSFPPDLPAATSLARLAGSPVDRERVLELVVEALRSGERPDRLDRWRRHAHTLGRRVRVGEIEGVATALRDDGALIVGSTPVWSGEVWVVG